jgi:FkbM family methyltransferase
LQNSVRAFRPDELGYRLAIGEFGGFVVAFRQGTVDEEVVRRHDIFFAGVPEYDPEPDHVIIDVGAHIGTFSMLAASKVPRGRVYAVEASRETFNYLTINIALNHLRNIEASHLALAGGEGRTVLYYDERNWGHSITKRLSSRGEEVQTKTLAGYMAEHGIERCDFIKFNCEGAEFPILLNTSAQVLERINLMFIHYHCDLAQEYDLDTLLSHLRESGFVTHVPNPTMGRGRIIARRVN